MGIVVFVAIAVVAALVVLFVSEGQANIRLLEGASHLLDVLDDARPMRRCIAGTWRGQPVRLASSREGSTDDVRVDVTVPVPGAKPLERRGIVLDGGREDALREALDELVAEVVSARSAGAP